MGNFKEEILSTLKEAEDFIAKKTSEDPTTNSTTWDIDYQPDLKRLYDDINKIVIKLEKVQKRIQTPQSEDLLNIARTLRNKYSRLLKKYSGVKEISATSQGGASFSSGEGAQYATPKAYSKKGAKNYYYKLGYKDIPKTKPKSFDKVKLWEDDMLNEMNNFQKQRLQSIEDIEKLLNEISPLISNAKNETATLFGGNPGSYDINSPIEITKSYLQDIKRILTEK